MWVAYQLGARDAFKGATHKPCLQCEVNANGQLLDPHKTLLEDYELAGPPGIIGKQHLGTGNIFGGILTSNS
jgi:hypothetical protein